MLKALFWIGSAVVVLGFAGFVIYYMRQAAAEEEVARQREREESGCLEQMKRTSDLAKQKNVTTENDSRVIDSANHYNHLLHQCYVEVTTYEHGESSVIVKTLISPADNTAVLWSVTGRIGTTGRECFGPDSMPLDCEVVDKRWKAYMTE
jgi:hypothetical protein